jgi:hypothetical protein
MNASFEHADSVHPVSRWLRMVLWIDVSCQIFFWGIPGILAMQRLARFWFVPIPKEILYVRLLGAYSLMWAVLFYLALRRPHQNLDILRVGVASHFLVVVTILAEWIIQGVPNLLSTAILTKPFWVVTMALNGFFGVALLFHWPPSILTAQNRQDEKRGEQ